MRSAFSAILGPKSNRFCVRVNVRESMLRDAQSARVSVEKTKLTQS